jgi:N-methylhydantoinase A
MSLAIAIDTGGTFTDVTLFDARSNLLWTVKVPSTPDDPSAAFLAGITTALRAAGEPAARLSQIFHGTTVATNLILEGKGAPIGLLTTAGFKHVLEIGRQDIPRQSNMFAWVKPKRPVPPERIFEVGGRLAADGSELLSLDEEAVRRAAGVLAGEGVKAIAICFLHSFTNPDHERRAGALVRAAHPDMLISLSSDVLPVFREFERTMATALNVYVMPAVSTYVARIGARLRDSGIRAPLLLMKSSGGVTGMETFLKVPAHAALSGPAAGVIGVQFVGQSVGEEDLIGIDIGGTSADISLVKGAAASITTSGRIGGWPLPLPMIDINTIGAGGGSIARVTSTGALTVGPESAGADPGPACYGRGGDLPTVTDAHVALGHLPPFLLGGALALDPNLARDAIRTRVAVPLGLDVDTAARGILAIVDNNMVGAIRVVSVERGHDPRDFALVPFGGAGPLHGGSLARLLQSPLQIVPAAPGVLSALGLLVAQRRADFQKTCLQRPPHIDHAQLALAFADLQRDAEAWLAAEGVPGDARDVTWQARLRYRHQGFELTVPWAGQEVTQNATAATIAAFHREHERLYTFAQPDTPVEIVTLGVNATGRIPRPALQPLPNGGALRDALIDHLPVRFTDGTVRVPTYTRTKLGAGTRIIGPAIVTQLDSTVLILAGQQADVHRFGSLLVREAR